MTRSRTVIVTTTNRRNPFWIWDSVTDGESAFWLSAMAPQGGDGWWTVGDRCGDVARQD
jgi:hypothetical protein